jgi:hypothetical protein
MKQWLGSLSSLREVCDLRDEEEKYVILWRRVEQGNPSGRIAKIYIGTERLTQSGILQPHCVSFYFWVFMPFQYHQIWIIYILEYNIPC